MLDIDYMTTEDIITYLDELNCWDDDNVEPMMQELCSRLGIEYGAYYDSYGVIDFNCLFNAILAA